MNHKNFHPEICKLLDELESLRADADLRARDLLRDNHDRAYSRATADTYAYCIMRIRDLNIGGAMNEWIKEILTQALEIKNLNNRLESQTQRLAESEEEVGHLKAMLIESDKMVIALRYDRNFWKQSFDQTVGRG